MTRYFIFLPIFLLSLISSAQVLVSQEPRHHNVFENSFVRVLDVRVPPGDTTQFHKHQTPSVFIVLQPVKTGSEVIMEETKATVLAKDATISFEGFYTTPRIHRVWNEDSSEFHVMDIEILSKKQHEIARPTQQKDFQFLFEEKPVRVYRLTLDVGKDIRITAKAPYLIVGLTDSVKARVDKKWFNKKGDFLFISSGQSIRFSNKDHLPYSFAILELK